MAAEEKYPSDCTGWEEHGFECVSKVACESDGHFDTDTGQAVTDGGGATEPSPPPTRAAVTDGEDDGVT